jgi:hypothetical protein
VWHSPDGALKNSASLKHSLPPSTNLKEKKKFFLLNLRGHRTPHHIGRMSEALCDLDGR